MACPPIAGGGPVSAAERMYDEMVKYGGNPPPPLGPLVRLYPKPISALPFHPSLPDAPDRPTISYYALELLSEAQIFMTKFVPRAFTVESKAKSSPPSAATVELLSHKVPHAEVPFESRPAGNTGTAEAWVARASEHENVARQGSLTWQELEHLIREPSPDDVRDTRVLLDWAKELGQDACIGAWEDVQAELKTKLVRAMPMVGDRVATVLEISASRDGEFLVVQVPVDASDLPGSKQDGAAAATTGRYVSVEHGYADEATLIWRKAVSNDPGGMIPSWAVKKGGSGSIVKEVGSVVERAARQRSGKVVD